MPNSVHWTPGRNRDRLVAGDVAASFLQAVRRGSRVRCLLSDERFPVGGRLIDTWALMKSLRPKDSDDDPSPGRDFHGEWRSNATHASVADADARPFRNGGGQSS